MSLYYYYAFTVKRVDIRWNTPDDYDAFYDWVAERSFLEIVSMVPEVFDKQKSRVPLHYHGLIRSLKPISRYPRLYGFHTKFVELTNERGLEAWLSYQEKQLINKDVDDQRLITYLIQRPGYYPFQIQTH